eukprot:TRINITY_DN43433_c0_g1_i1.p1 TRINITY_DN43433_c0_g1~~TRINITY_DN43433_c0_g1_i1.p1  ORF type:complete len:366 (+),score=100.57 TRINITY_DN43433_c0_g1_i1:58-1155(+)
MGLPSRAQIKEEVRNFVETNGFKERLGLVRKVVAMKLSTDLDSAAGKKELRAATMETLREMLLEKPSLLQEVQAPELRKAVRHSNKSGSKRSSSGGGKSGKKRKHEHDGPPPPKRPLGAYFLFLQKNREKIAADMTKQGLSTSTTDVGKRAGELFRSLQSRDPAAHKALMAEVEKESEQYKRDYSNYCAKYGKPGKRAKTSHHPDAPKRPLSAYLIFANKMRPQILEQLSAKGIEGREAMTQVTVIAGKKWNADPEHPQKRAAVEEAKKRKAEYDVAMKAFVAKHGEVRRSPKKSSGSKSSKKKGTTAPKRRQHKRTVEDGGDSSSSDSSSSDSDSSSGSDSSSSGGSSSSSSSDSSSSSSSSSS